ncbi:hypothetical protein SDC9_199694 [bioreactor metagenome]|uniref:Uncharacterized protein n=1 Tax=bioreactor metagenome TaxID=1076179 RepID=A0A645IMG5_9ZZZZ
MDPEDARPELPPAAGDRQRPRGPDDRHRTLRRPQPADPVRVGVLCLDRGAGARLREVRDQLHHRSPPLRLHRDQCPGGGHRPRGEQGLVQLRVLLPARLPSVRRQGEHPRDAGVRGGEARPRTCRRRVQPPRQCREPVHPQPSGGGRPDPPAQRDRQRRGRLGRGLRLPPGDEL